MPARSRIPAMLGRRVERLRQRLRKRASQSGEWSVPEVYYADENSVQYRDYARLRVYFDLRAVRNSGGNILVEAGDHGHIAQGRTLNEDRVHRIEDECERNDAARFHFVQHPGARYPPFGGIQHQYAADIRAAGELVARARKHAGDAVEVIAR